MRAKPIWKIACLAGLAMTAAISSAETYAIMLGINDYPDAVDAQGNPLKDKDGNPINPDLTGAVNDVNRYKDILVNKYGVKSDNIRQYLDKAAGESGFVEAWKWALSQAKPGDNILWIYSGHGSTMPATDEEDGKEEVIVLADDKVVPGDFFGEIARAVAGRNINSTFIFDSCYSGGMSRGEFSYDGKTGTPRNRFLAGDLFTRNLKKVPLGQLDAVRAAAKQGAPAQTGSYAFLFGGQENQTTTDLDFKDPATPDHGLFTLVMTTLIDAEPNAPLGDIMTVIADFIKEKGFEQKPVFEFSSPERSKLGLLIK